jgi:hypothetical protein
VSLNTAGGDGGDALHWSDVTTPSRVGAGLTSVPLSRVPPSSFEGCDVESVQEWAVQCHGVDTDVPTQLPHSARDGRTGRVGGTAPGYDSQAVLEGRPGGDSPFDPNARGMPEHLMLWSEEWARRHGPRAQGPRARRRIVRGGATPSSETENCPRGCQALERGGESPEGALGPRARWRIARGGPWPVG